MAKEFGKVLSLPRRDGEKSDRQFVTALARGLEVIRAFRPSDGSLGNQELAERTCLPKATVSRITHTLTTLGYLDYLPRLTSYVISPSVLSLGHACVAATAIRRASNPLMQDLAEYADGSVALGARDRLTMIYLDVARGSHAATFSLDAGSYVPIYASAMGAAYLWALPEKDRGFLMDAIAQATGEDWPAIRVRLKRAYKEMANDGFCIFEGIYDRGINGVGVVLVQADGTPHPFSCSGPAYLFSRGRMHGDIGPRLLAMRSGVAANLVRR